MNKTNKKLKVVGVAEQCIDCCCYINPNRKIIFESLRSNPDYKEGEPLFKKWKTFPQCEDCGYNKFC